MPSDKPSRLEFNSDHVPLRDRLGVVREVIGPLVGMDIDIYPGRPFIGNILHLTLPGIQAFSCETLAVARRTINNISDGNDFITIALATKNGTHFSHRGHDNIISPGGGAMMLWSETLKLSSADGNANASIGVFVPRSSIAPLVRNVNDKAGQLISPDNEALSLLAFYVTTLQGMPEITGDLAKLAARHIQDLIVLALGGGREADAPPVQRGLAAVRLQKAKAFIIENSCLGDLTIGQVAAEQHLTERYVQRLFEADGTTFSRYLLDERLQQVCHRLQSPRWMSRKIAQIAFDCGFAEGAYFNRVFRKRFGMTPSDMRASMLRGEF